MTRLSEIIASEISRRTDNERQLGELQTGVLTRYEYFKDRFILQDSGLRIYEQGLGSSFIVGHIELGKIGTGHTPQPYLGDSRTGWDLIGPSGLVI